MADNTGAGTSNRGGFQNMSLEKRRQAASKGGSMSGGNFRNDPKRASEAAKKRKK